MASPWTARTRTGGPAGARAATGWYPVARSTEVGTTPRPVGAGGRAYVVLRLRPGAEVTALPARCPHRLVPLAHATVVDGRVRCRYHGWQFGPEGRCLEIPSLGPAGTPPPRADLAVPWAVEERDGWVWLAPERTPAVRPPRSGAVPAPEPVPPLPAPAGPVLGNLDPCLEHAWHPVALATELQDGGYVQVRLLGRTWTVHRRGAALDADPPAWGVVERYGLVWIAPAEPRAPLVEVPEATDPRAVPSWLLPARSSAPAGALADLLLDAAHVPVVHPGDAHAVREPVAVVTPEPGGSTSVRETGPEGDRPRRRTTAVHRAPFQLRLRTEELGTGAARTTLFALQPEDDDSTRVYACLFLTPPAGTTSSPEEVAAQVAAAAAALADDLEVAALLESTGLPLLARDELHVPADAPGVALRRTLADLAAGEHRSA